MQGQTNNTAVIVETPEDIAKIDFTRDIYLFSQTTMSIEGFQKLIDTIRQRSKKNFEFHDTICRNVANRVANLKAFAAEQDLVLFVGGKKSSNAKVLFEHCREANPHTVFIEGPEEIEGLEVKGYGLREDMKIGICGATSTPLWLMEQCKNKIENGQNSDNRRSHLGR